MKEGNQKLLTKHHFKVMSKEGFKSEKINLSIRKLKIISVNRFWKDVTYQESKIIRAIKRFCNIPIIKFKYLYKIDVVVNEAFLRKGMTIFFRGERFVITNTSGSLITIESVGDTGKNFEDTDFRDNYLIQGGCVLMMS
jgi:hypothetical protein